MWQRIPTLLLVIICTTGCPKQWIAEGVKEGNKDLEAKVQYSINQHEALYKEDLKYKAQQGRYLVALNDNLVGEQGILAQIQEIKTSEAREKATESGPVRSTGGTSAPTEAVPKDPPAYEESQSKDSGESLMREALAQIARGEDPNLTLLQVQTFRTWLQSKKEELDGLERYLDYLKDREEILILEAKKKKKELERDLKDLEKPAAPKEKKVPAAILVPAEPVPIDPPHFLPPDPFRGHNPSVVPVPVTWMGSARARGNLSAGYEVWDTGEMVRYHERRQHTSVLPVNSYVQGWRNPRNIGHMEDQRAYLQPSWNRWRYVP